MQKSDLELTHLIPPVLSFPKVCRPGRWCSPHRSVRGASLWGLEMGELQAQRFVIVAWVMPESD